MMEIEELTLSLSAISYAIYDRENQKAWEEDKSSNAIRDKLVKEIVSKDERVSDFWKTKYVKESAMNWDKFYNRHQTKFFKDRHYLSREFKPLEIGENGNEGTERKEDDEGEKDDKELDDDNDENDINSHCNDVVQSKFGKENVILLELGCGVGNAFYPLLRKFPNLKVFGSDFSKHAIELIKKNEFYDAERVNVWVQDASITPVPSFVPEVDIVLVFFVLSALSSQEAFITFMKHAAANLKPGGHLLFRDYGRYDQAQVRFSKERRINKLEENLYVRQDGTLAYFFTIEEIHQIFTSSGLVKVESEYIRRLYRNRKLGNEMHRVWVQSTYMKPM